MSESPRQVVPSPRRRALSLGRRLAAALAVSAALVACGDLDRAASVAAIVALVSQSRDDPEPLAAVNVRAIGSGEGATGSVLVRSAGSSVTETVSLGDSTAAASTFRFPPNTELILQRVPGGGNIVSYWGGACGVATSNECRLRVNGNMEVTAEFVVPRITFSIARRGKATGSVTASYPGTSSNPDNGETLVLPEPNLFVSLRAESGSGSRAVWGGNCADTDGDTCTMFVNSAAEVSLDFVRTRMLELELNLSAPSVALRDHAVTVSHIPGSTATLNFGAVPSAWRLNADGVATLDGTPTGVVAPDFSTGTGSMVYRLTWPVDVGDELAFNMEIVNVAGMGQDTGTWGGACGAQSGISTCSRTVDDPAPLDQALDDLRVSAAIGRVGELTVNARREDGGIPSRVILLSGARDIDRCESPYNNCVVEPTVGSRIRLSLEPGSGERLQRWELAQTSPAPFAELLCNLGAEEEPACVFQMPAADVAATAVFALFADVSVALDGADGDGGAGGVVRIGDAVLSSAADSAPVAVGSMVALVAEPALGFVFLGWNRGGVCEHAGRSRFCEFTLAANTDVSGAPPVATATFAEAAVLTLRSRSPGGQFTAEIQDQAGDSTLTLSIGSNRMARGATVTVTVTGLRGDDPTRFLRWSPGSICAGSMDPACGFVLDSDMTVDATLRAARLLAASVSGDRPDSAGNPATGAVMLDQTLGGGVTFSEILLPAGRPVGNVIVSAGTTAVVAVGAVVTLRADAGAGAGDSAALFDAWTRDFNCDLNAAALGDPVCRFSMPDRDIAAVASYASRAPAVTLSFSGSGAGSVSAEIGRPSRSSANVDSTEDEGSGVVLSAIHGSSVTLTASARGGSLFTGWTGCPSPSGETCGIIADGVRSVTASFAAAAALSLSVAEGGQVTLAGAAVVMGNVAPGPYFSGQRRIAAPALAALTLTATPSELFLFTGWTPASACNGPSSEPSCVVMLPMIGATLSVSAGFSRDVRAITIAVEGSGSVMRSGETLVGADIPTVTILSLPATAFSLSAAHDVAGNDIFWRWQGGPCDGLLSMACNFTPSQAVGTSLTVTAVFRRPRLDLLVVGDSNASVEVTGASSGGGIYAGGESAAARALARTPNSQITLAVPPSQATAFVRWDIEPSDAVDPIRLGSCGQGLNCVLDVDVSSNGEGWRPLRVNALFRTVFAVTAAAGTGGAVNWSYGPDAGMITGTATAGAPDSFLAPSEFDLTLLAAPADGHLFSRWDGDAPCGDAARCVFAPTAPVSATAVFAAARTVSVSVVSSSGGGGAVLYPGGMVSAGDPGATFTAAHGMSPSLSAFPAPGALLSHWTGPCVDRFAAVCELTPVTGDIDVVAHFAQVARLVVSTGGDALRRRVAVTLEPPGGAPPETLDLMLSLDASSATRSLASGTTVILVAADDTTATPSAQGDFGSRFTAWAAGPCNASMDHRCAFSVNADTEATAAFVGLAGIAIARGPGDGAAAVTYSATGGIPETDMFTLGPADQEVSQQLRAPTGGTLEFTVAVNANTIFRHGSVSADAGLLGGCDALGVCSYTAPPVHGRNLEIRLPLASARRMALAVVGNGGVTATVPASAVDPGGSDPRVIRAPQGSLITLMATPASGNFFLSWSEGACSGSVAPSCAVVVGSRDSTQRAEFAAAVNAVVSVMGAAGEMSNNLAAARAGAALDYDVAHPGNAAVETSAGRLSLAGDPIDTFPVLAGSAVSLSLARGPETMVMAGGIAVMAGTALVASCGPDTACAFTVPTGATALSVRVTMQRGHRVTLNLLGNGQVDYSVDGALAGSVAVPAPRQASFFVRHGLALGLVARPPVLSGTVFSAWRVNAAAAPSANCAVPSDLRCDFPSVTTATEVTASYGQQYRLQLQPSGGSGRVAYALSDGRSGIWELGGGAIFLDAVEGTVVTLTATQNPAWEFVRWFVAGGRCGDDVMQVCSFPFDAAQILLRAEFATVPLLTLTHVATPALGDLRYQVNSSPTVSVSMPSTQVHVAVGDEITLTGTTVAPNAFFGWVLAQGLEGVNFARPACLGRLEPSALSALCTLVSVDALDELQVAAWFAKPTTATLNVGASAMTITGSWRFSEEDADVEPSAVSITNASPSQMLMDLPSAATITVSLESSGANALILGIFRGSASGDRLCPGTERAGETLTCDLTLSENSAQNDFFIATATGQTFTLRAGGGGRGLVSYEVMGGRSCMSSASSAAGACEGPLLLPAGSVVSVTATTVSGSFFSGWTTAPALAGCPSVDASPTPPFTCDFTLNGDQTVTATFERVRTAQLNLSTVGDSITGLPYGSVAYSLDGGATFPLLLDSSRPTSSLARSLSLAEGSVMPMLRFIPRSGYAYAGVTGGGDASCEYQPVGIGEMGSCSLDFGAAVVETDATGGVDWFVRFVAVADMQTWTFVTDGRGVGGAGTISHSAPGVASGTPSLALPAILSRTAGSSSIALERRSGNLTLVAAARSGHVFDGWSSICTSPGSRCVLPLVQTSPVTATAYFLPERTVAVTVVETPANGVSPRPFVEIADEDGNVRSTARAAATGSFTDGQTRPVTLRVVNDTDVYTFDGWIGVPSSCTSAGLTCTFNLGANDVAATASFTPRHLLTVSFVGAPGTAGSVEVVSGGAMVTAAPSSNTLRLRHGSQVTLTPAAGAPARLFVGWTDARCQSAGRGVCTIAALLEPTTVAPRFETPYVWTFTPPLNGMVAATLNAGPATSPINDVTVADQLVFTAMADSGYEFSAWTGCAPGSGDPVGQCTLSGSDLGMNGVVSATFRAVMSTLSVIAGANGSVAVELNGATAGAATAGAPSEVTATVEDAVTLTAEPAAGYAFAGWTLTPSSLSCNEDPATSATCTLPVGSITAGGSAAASFVAIVFDVAVTASGSGTVSVSRDGGMVTSVAAGMTETIAATVEDMVTLTAAPAAGHAFSAWALSGVSMLSCDEGDQSGATCTLAAGSIIADATAEAIFVPLLLMMFDVVVASTGQGTVSVSRNGSTVTSVAAGMTETITATVEDTVTLTANPAAGHAFAGWTFIGIACAASNPVCAIDVGQVTADSAATASFLASMTPLVLLNFQVGAGGSASVSVGGISTPTTAGETLAVVVPPGEDAVLEAAPDTGYVFDGWTLTLSGGLSCTEGGTSGATCTLVAGSVSTGDSAAAAFRRVAASLDVIAGANGSVAVELNGVDVGSVVAGAPSEVTATVADSVTLTAEPAAGYEFGAWTLTGGLSCDEDPATSATCTLPVGSITAGGSAAASFVAIVFDVVVAASGAGTVSVSRNGSTVTSVAAGMTETITATVEDTVTLTANPAAGHAFAGWTFIGIACAASNPVCAIDVGQVTADSAATASFLASMTPLVLLNFQVGAGGSASVSVGGTRTTAAAGETLAVVVPSGEDAVLEAAPDTGYVFDGWTLTLSGGLSCTEGGTSGATCTLVAGSVSTGDSAAAEFRAVAGGASWIGPGEVSVSSDGAIATAVPYADGAFVRWTTGPCAGSAEPACDISTATGITTAEFLPFVADGAKALAFGLGYDIDPPPAYYQVLLEPSLNSGFTAVDGLEMVDPANQPNAALARLELPSLLLSWDGSYMTQACDASDSCIAAVGGQAVAREQLARAVGQLAPASSSPTGFAAAVALSGDGTTLVAGNPADSNGDFTGVLNSGHANFLGMLMTSTPTTPLDGSGAAYIYSGLPAGPLAAVAYIRAPNPDAEDRFGAAVALSADGSTLAVGAPGEGGAGRSGAHNADIGAFAPAPGDPVDLMAYTDALADDTAAAAGAVYVYRRAAMAGTWSLEAYVKAPNAEASDEFGASVALSSTGSMLAVGAPGEDGDTGRTGNFTGNGSCTVDGNVFSCYELEERPADYDVALNNNGATDSGAAYIYRRAEGGTSWSIHGYIKAHFRRISQNGLLSPGAGDRFGAAVALSGDGLALAVGAPHEDGDSDGPQSPNTFVGTLGNNGAPEAGAVWIFTRSSTEWETEAYVKSPASDSDDLFGSAVALSADGVSAGNLALAVGAVGEDGSDTGVFHPGDGAGYANAIADSDAADSGAAYIYRRTPGAPAEPGSWTTEAYVKAPNADAGDAFGSAVALSGDGATLAAGATSESGAMAGVFTDTAAALSDNTRAGTGAAYVYRRADGSVWNVHAYVKAPDPLANGGFGSAVALSADGAALAAARQSDASGVDGRLYLY